MNKRERSGPSTDPCGTPIVTVWYQSEFVSNKETNCLLLLKYNANQPFPTFLMPYYSNLVNKILRSTVSNALHKSKKMLQE